MTATFAPAAQWIHHDEHLSQRLVAAATRARALDWTSSPLAERAAELQALVIDTAYQMAKLAGSASRVVSGAGQETLYLDPRPSADVPLPRRAASLKLYRTLDLLAQGAQQTSPAETFAPRPPGVETAALPAVAVVAMIVVGGAALAYCGAQAAKVIDRQLERKEGARKLVAAHSAALEVVDRHTAREDAAGKPLPLDAASRAALDALADEQQAVAGQTLPDFGADLLPTGSSPFNFGAGALVGLGLALALMIVTK